MKSREKSVQHQCIVVRCNIAIDNTRSKSNVSSLPSLFLPMGDSLPFSTHTGFLFISLSSFLLSFLRSLLFIFFHKALYAFLFRNCDECYIQFYIKIYLILIGQYITEILNDLRYSYVEFCNVLLEYHTVVVPITVAIIASIVVAVLLRFSEYNNRQTYLSPTAQKEMYH